MQNMCNSTVLHIKQRFCCRYETTKNEDKIGIDETLFLYLLTTIMLRKFLVYESEHWLCNIACIQWM